MNAKLDELAQRQSTVSEKWRRSPSGLSAMGFKRVTKPANPSDPNPVLRDMAEKAKRGT